MALEGGKTGGGILKVQRRQVQDRRLELKASGSEFSSLSVLSHLGIEESSSLCYWNCVFLPLRTLTFSSALGIWILNSSLDSP